mmetsp:Transcript_6132/g.8867  ORF Transcript_6132/g.8867 Transcript_6132/m.8867 type:complete len:174 (+) Transcript_6132:88-609(+)|eukprot:CAMPEP_0195515104 /NCGR_PEP_ID=MMETSP0794_2-20130614/6291_1 /TAXON_ID=515487 /ORGANISM="Stephanopyxis turris, Strain CCMP 815" /LENGTH=173 /DNA_ID=CAMNT_0040643485 /DNA_START=84 /DNA_END=605 /DNA_ORIENTATION=+
MSSPPLPRVPPFAPLQKEGINSLLSRVNNFLPVIAASNKSLAEMEDCKSLQIDATLTNGDCSNSDDGVEDDQATGEDDDPSSDKSPTIELSVALGDFDQSAIAMLEEEDANKNDVNDTGEKESRSGGDLTNNGNAREDVVSRLLTKKTNDEHSENVNAGSEGGKKKILIEELS